MNWQMWLLVGLLAVILASLAGLTWLAWLQNRAISILQAEVRAGRDQAAKSEKMLLEALQRQGEHYQGMVEYLRERIALIAQEGQAKLDDANQARAELDQAQRDAKKLVAILARKERRENPF